jgi:hypothetical protein
MSLRKIIFNYLQNNTELYDVSWILFLSDSAVGFLLLHGVLTVHVTTVRTLRNRCSFYACNLF